MISNFDMTFFTNSLKMLLNSSSLPIKCPGTRLQAVMVSNYEFLGDLTNISGFGNATQIRELLPKCRSWKLIEGT